MNNLIQSRKNITLSYNKEQIELIKRTYCAGASDDELKLFIHVAKSKQLDILSGQIYSIARKTKDRGVIRTIQVGIDGMRAIAHRTGECVGISEAEFAYKKDFNGRTSKQIDIAKVTVQRLIGGKHLASFTATAYWDEYVSEDKYGKKPWMYEQKPHLMLGKCAEVAALRKGFPFELGGIYANEEMPSPEGEAKEELKEVKTVKDKEVKTVKNNVSKIKQGIDRIEKIEKIKQSLSKKTEGKTPAEKGLFLHEFLGVKSWNEIESASIERLDAFLIDLH